MVFKFEAVQRGVMFGLVLLPLLSSGAVLAQDNASPPEHPVFRPGACRPDVERFCSSVVPGGGRIIACLRDHAADLSQPCRDEAAALKAAREKWAEQSH
jgi:hypothetical protein